MDYINYVKQYPLRGQIGFGGGATTIGLGTYFTPIPPNNMGNRSLFGGGNNMSGTQSVTVQRYIGYLNMTSLAAPTEFGALSQNAMNGGGASDSTRGIFIGGSTRASYYVTIATTSNTTSFGTWNAYSNSYPRQGFGAWSNGVRAVAMGSEGQYPSYTDRVSMDYVTIQTTGNSSDFGDLGTDHARCAATGDLSRALCCGGGNSDAPTNAVVSQEYITVATTGNATNFGDSTEARNTQGGASNNTRGVIGGGSCCDNGGLGGKTNYIDYNTIQSTGSATDFGDLSVSRGWVQGSGSGNGRAVWIGGTAGNWPSSNYGSSNVMDYVTIASTGNASDFGDYNDYRSGVLGNISANP